MTTKELKEKFLDSGFPQKAAERTSKFVEELYLKDMKYVADILGVQVGGDLGIAGTETEKIKYLTLMYGTLTCQEHEIQEIKARMLAEIKKLDSKLAEDLINLKLSREE